MIQTSVYSGFKLDLDYFFLLVQQMNLQVPFAKFIQYYLILAVATGRKKISRFKWFNQVETYFFPTKSKVDNLHQCIHPFQKDQEPRLQMLPCYRSTVLNMWPQSKECEQSPMGIFQEPGPELDHIIVLSSSRIPLFCKCHHVGPWERFISVPGIRGADVVISQSLLSLDYI